MAFKMTAKWPGCCRECKEGIVKGDRIVHAGPRENYHVVCFGNLIDSMENPAAPAVTPAAVEAPAEADTPDFGGDCDAAEGFAWGMEAAC